MAQSKIGAGSKKNSFIVDPTLILRYLNTANNSIKTITMVTDAADNNAPPRLPPALPRIEGTSQRARGRVLTIRPGRNPLGVAINASSTHHMPPPACVDVHHPHPGTRSSGVSSLSLQLDQLATPQPSPTLGAGALSPDDLPNLVTCIQDDDSVASGDDSIGWDKEAERVIHLFNLQAEAEEEAALDNMDETRAVTNAVHEFMTLIGDRGKEELKKAHNFENRGYLKKPIFEYTEKPYP